MTARIFMLLKKFLIDLPKRLIGVYFYKKFVNNKIISGNGLICFYDFGDLIVTCGYAYHVRMLRLY